MLVRFGPGLAERMYAHDDPAKHGDAQPVGASEVRQGTLFRLVCNFAGSEPRRSILIIAAVALLVLAVWLGRSWWANVEWRDLGYPGVFLLSFLGSFSMVLPVPGLISLCASGGFLNPYVAGLFAGVGEAIGELSGYAVGYGGKAVVEKHAFYQRVQVWMERRGTLVIFLVSVIPNPIVDVVGIAAGATRYPLFRFLGVVLAGKILKGVAVAYACHAGFQLLPWLD